MQTQLYTFFKEKGIELKPSLNLTENIKLILNEKQTIITNLSEQLTRCKCEQIKYEKLIKSLQDKINQLAPNISNTGSNFMMSSEFKSNFEEFITTILPTSLGTLLDKPHLFSKCTSDIFMHTYTTISDQLSGIICNICQVLKISHLKTQQKDLEYKIKLSILKILQEFWQVILPFREQNKFQYVNSSNNISIQILQEINEVLLTEDYLQMRRQLYKLCIYMVLQDKQWEFVSLNTSETVKYSKKQFTCIDGWIKDGGEALMILGGIKKEGHLHPNLKNFVIPLIQDENCDIYKELRFKLKEQQSIKMIPQQTIKLSKMQSPPKLELDQSIDLEKDVQILLPLMNDSQFISKNKSNQLLHNKENYPYALNKKTKKKDKLKFSVDTSLNLHQKSPKNRIKKHDESIKHKKLEIQQIDEKIFMIRQESKGKKKSLVISKNINDVHFDEIMLPLREKNVGELPMMSKQAQIKKKIKANTSRKNSVGKIISQNHMINHADTKQNTQSINNSKMKNKEKVYKDIIKEKLLDDKIQDKTQHSLNILYPKSKTDREKKKQENRPLKIQNNANKLREKYIF